MPADGKALLRNPHPKGWAAAALFSRYPRQAAAVLARADIYRVTAEKGLDKLIIVYIMNTYRKNGGD